MDYEKDQEDSLFKPILPTPFYSVLLDVLSIKEFKSVTYRGSADYVFLELAYQEKQSRKDEKYDINMLDTTGRWENKLAYYDPDAWPDEPRLIAPSTAPAWMDEIHWYQEGIGQNRDVFIDSILANGISVSEMAKQNIRFRWLVFISFNEPFLKLDGYSSHYFEGFCIGIRNDVPYLNSLVEKYKPNKPVFDEKYLLAAQWIKEADGILITAGAGMGVDSGLPDFRGSKGLWEHYPALGKQSLSFEDIANPKMFISNPKLAWGFYGHRWNTYNKTNPHKGFKFLRRWSESKKNGAFVFTSNIDGHFQEAMFSDDEIYECHGSINFMQCCDYCDDVKEIGVLDYYFDIDNQKCQLTSDIPKCPNCNSTMRPNILMFDDTEWKSERYYAQKERYTSWLEKVTTIVVIEIGAGTSIPTVRLESEKQAGRKLIRINLRESEIPTNQGISFEGGALDVLTELDKYL